MNLNTDTMQKNRELVITKDGSPTLFVAELNEHYHSIHGALQEALHVFIQAGVQALLEKGHSEINLFEVGFGTGTNALLTEEFASDNNIKIRYESLEAYPLSQEEATAFAKSLKLSETRHALFVQLHKAEWDKEVEINKNFSLLKRHARLEEYDIESAADLIYYDAFAPNAQAYLWEKEIFEKMYAQLKPGAMLVTYCAKGVVKRTLKAVGFEVESIPGPPGKREMTRAYKPK